MKLTNLPLHLVAHAGDYNLKEQSSIDFLEAIAVSDALHLVKHSTSVCLVIQAGRTTVQATQRAKSALVAARAKDIGIVLNRVAVSRYNPYGYTFRESASPIVTGRIATLI